MSLSEDVFRAYYELAGVDEPEDNYGFNWHNEDGLLDVIEDFQGDPPFGPPNGTRYIAGINWHNPSWLNSSEVKQALDAHHDVDFEWTLLWNCLQSLDEQYGDRHSRLVFWFDS
jgi:hypothetical protein